MAEHWCRECEKLSLWKGVGGSDSVRVCQVFGAAISREGGGITSEQ